MKRLQYLVFVFILLSFSSCCTQRKVKDSLLSLDTLRYRKKHNEKFFESVKDGDLQGVREALNRRRVNVNSSDKLHQSALMWAAWTGREDIFQYLLQFDDDLKSKKMRKKCRAFLKYGKETKSKYNAFFCLITSDKMASQHKKECIKQLLDSEKKWTKKNKLLYKVDSFKENALHKAARYGDASLMQFLIDIFREAEKNKSAKFASVLESKNKEGDTPLIVAIKSQHPEIVRILIRNDADMSVRVKIGKADRSLSLLAFDDGRGDYYTFLEVLKGILYHCKDEEKRGIAESKKKYRREDKDLAETIERYSKLQVNPENINDPFYTSYARLAVDKVETEEELEDKHYKNIVNDFFALLRKSSLCNDDIEELKTRIQASPFLLTKKSKNNTLTIEESALEVAIKNGNYDAFRLIFDLSDMSRLPKVSQGYIDYFICAIVHGRDKIIRCMLEYNDVRGKGAVKDVLMSSTHYHFGGKTVFNNKTNIPVVAFLKNDTLRSDRELLHKVLLYYQETYSNPTVAGLILKEALTYNREDFILLLYKYSRDKDGFYLLDRVEDSQLHLLFYYLEKGYYRALEQYVKGTNLTVENLNLIVDTRKEDRPNFFEVLADLLIKKPDDPILKSIKKLLEEYGFYIFSD